ncbi:MAG: SDR family oxidoreductase [Rhodospirillaceae bacterium]|nr:SDR family oxidoreductase [Rhodospirillaceae bacterium]
MPTVMITGANRGLGLEFARQYGADGWTGIGTCRDPFNPGELATIEGDIQVHGLDVANHPQVDHLAKDLNGVAIDVLINNAGIYGPRNYKPEDIDYAAWEEVMRVNVMAPLKVAATFAGNVAAGDQKKLVTVSSRMGSIADNTSGDFYVYRSSKAAVNAAMVSFAHDTADRGLIVALLHPGWVKTDMGGDGGDLTPTESIARLRKVIAGLGPADNGHFFNHDGSKIPW